MGFGNSAPRFQASNEKRTRMLVDEQVWTLPAFISYVEKDQKLIPKLQFLSGRYSSIKRFTWTLTMWTVSYILEDKITDDQNFGSMVQINQCRNKKEKFMKFVIMWSTHLFNGCKSEKLSRLCFIFIDRKTPKKLFSGQRKEVLKVKKYFAMVSSHTFSTFIYLSEHSSLNGAVLVDWHNLSIGIIHVCFQQIKYSFSCLGKMQQTNSCYHERPLKMIQFNQKIPHMCQQC